MQPHYPGMGWGFIDYLVRYWQRAHITSGGSDLFTLDSGVVPEWTTMVVFTNTGHTVGPLVSSCRCDVEIGQVLPLFDMMFNMRAMYQRVDSMLVSSGERYCSGAYLGYLMYGESWMTRKFPESCG